MIFSGGPDFAGATFTGNSYFAGATFTGGGRAHFGDVTFAGTAGFDLTEFQNYGYFLGATFRSSARFPFANFRDHAIFVNATFHRDTTFEGVTFAGGADFLHATFHDSAYFLGATFAGGPDFRDATFGKASFQGATFAGGPAFRETVFGEASFEAAHFERAREFGPVFILGRVGFARAVFADHVTFHLSARKASLVGVTFRAGADLFLRWAQVELDDADFARPSLVAASAPGADLFHKHLLGWEEPVEGGWRHRLDVPPSGFAPRVVSLRRAKVGDLALSGVDLRACRFEGAHGLDRMRLELVQFAETPPGWVRRRLFPWRWTRRQVLAEEHKWRHVQRWREGWYGEELKVEGDRSGPLPPERIAAIYRMLRKGREDTKDEPGAADFYYGEMEMRRQRPGINIPGAVAAGSEGLDARPAARAERLILWLYWLVSGYGLRASRALVSLLVTILAFALCFWWFGFTPRQGIARSLLFSADWCEHER